MTRISTNKYPIHRKGGPKNFYYVWKNGKRVKDATTLARVRGLGIPPAYTHVRIYGPAKKIQAKSLDSKKRVQYKYHSKWVQERDRKKYRALIAFAEAYPKITRKINSILPRKGPPKTKEQMIALATGVLNTCRLRPGNKQHLKNTGSYGTTTLRPQHFRRGVFKGKKCIAVRFKGKSGVINQCLLPVTKPVTKTLDALLKSKKNKKESLFALPGGSCVTSHDVNNFLHKIGGKHVTAKGFRTYHANVLFLQHAAPTLRNAHGSMTSRKKMANMIAKAIAFELHHTPATMKKSYLFKPLFDLYVDEPETFKRKFYKKKTEKALTRFLKQNTTTRSKVPKMWKKK